MIRMSLYLFDHNYRKSFRTGDKEKKKLAHVEVAGADRGIGDASAWYRQAPVKNLAA
jgi:hypothetical protein